MPKATTTTKTKPAKVSTASEKTKKKLSAYNIFVRDTLPGAKKENPDMSQAELMKEVGRLWRESPNNPKGSK